jgi:inner membrane protein
MDPLAHTLAGASLARTGLERLTPLATATLVVGANLPDVDAVANFWGGDASLWIRRGWTHGALALVVLPFVLTGLVLAVDRILRRDRADRARAGPLLALSWLSIWSHPALDWLNTYGVRLLMPFSGRWFYGDAVFIVDPWLWLLFGAAAVVAWTRRPPGATGWLLVGVATTALLLTAEEVPTPARWGWMLGMGGMLAARRFAHDERRLVLLARWCMGAAAVYVALMIAGSIEARSHAAAWLERQGRAPRQVMAGPLPANPFVREIIARHDDRYSFHRVDLMSGAVSPLHADIAVNGPTPVTEAALAAPGMRGMRNWLRFPSYEVETLADGYRVTVRDVRYSRFGARARGIGIAVVELDAGLRPR